MLKTTAIRFGSKENIIFLTGEGKIFMPDTPIRSVILDSLVALNHTTKVDLEKQASQI